MTRSLAFFGAFNPPTAAHVELARFALEQTGRDTAIFVPSKAAYISQEQGKDFAYSDELRLAMLRAAAASRPWMDVCGWEILRDHQPRTYETLCHLKEEGLHASLLLGSDKLPELETGWKNVRQIAREFGIVCLSRGCDHAEQMLRDDPFLRSLSPDILVLETPEQTKHVSSTEVRRLARELPGSRAELSRLVPEEILDMLECSMPERRSMI